MDKLLAAAEADDSDEYEISVDEALENSSANDGAIDEVEVAEASDESIVDDNALACRILEFYPSEQKMCYKIEGTTTLPEFKNKSFSVLRKYEDFLWLHERLTENKSFSGVLIPHLPAKVTWVNPDPSQISQKVVYENGLDDIRVTDQFQKRAHQLNRFLRRVCRHKLLREDVHMVVFLEYEEEIKPINDKSWFGTPVWYWDYTGKNKDDTAKKVRTWTNLYKSKMKEVLPCAEAMSTSSRDIAAVETQLVNDFREEWDDQASPLMRVFRHMSSGLIRSQINHHLRAQIEESMTDVLEDYIGTATATTEMIDRSAALFALSEDKEKSLSRTKKDMEGYEAAGTSSSSRAKSTAKKLAKLTAEHEELVQACSETAKAIPEELSIAATRRAADFKELFVKLAQHEIHQAENRISTWEEFLREMKRVENQPPPESMETAIVSDTAIESRP